MTYWKGRGKTVGNITVTVLFCLNFPRRSISWVMSNWKAAHVSLSAWKQDLPWATDCGSSGRMLVVRNWGHSVLWHLGTIFFPTCGPVRCIMNTGKDLLSKDNSCNSELCICWLEEINSWPSEIGRVLRKCLEKFGATDGLVVANHEKRMEQFSFQLFSLGSKNKPFPLYFKADYM